MRQLPTPPSGPILPVRPAAEANANGNGKLPAQATYTEIPYRSGGEAGAEPDARSLLEYARILRRAKGTLLLFACAGALAGFLITLPQTPIYQARTSLEIVGINDNFLNFKQADPLAENSNSSDTSDIQTQIRILQSESLMDRVLAKLQTGETPPAPPGRFAALRKALNLPAPSPPAGGASEALRYAQKNFKVRAPAQTRIVEVTVDSMNPQVAQVFANTLANEFIDQNLEARWKTTEHTGQWLSHELDDTRVRLERSEDAVQQYARQAGLIFTDDKTNVSEDRLIQAQQALSAAETDRIVKQTRWETANSSPPEALPDVLNDPSLRDYEAKLTELERQLADLRIAYTPEHPKVQRLMAQVATLESALDRERGDILKRIRNEYEEAQRKETLLSAEYQEQRSAVTAEGGKAVEYNILKREVESNRQLYDAMLQQLKQATLASALRASNIRVVDPAKLPRAPYKPDIPITSSLGLLGGAFLGAAFVILRERADRTIQNPNETAFYLNLPELGIIPSDVSGIRAGLRVPVAASPGATPELATLQRKPSMVAESFRATLVSILFSGEQDGRPRVMVVTSSNPSEGKSTVVSNLGIAVAEVSQKVLLIDADLRKPRLHHIFNLENELGLSDLLRSKQGLPESLDGLIQASGVPDLYVLTSGSTTAAATSLLYSARMPDLLARLKTQFDTIFIDTPPMLQISDARVLGRMVDQVILVVRSGKTTRDAALAARQRFSEDGTQILGTILNDWNPKQSANGYYGYYRNYYSGYYRGYGNEDS